MRTRVGVCVCVCSQTVDNLSCHFLEAMYVRKGLSLWDLRPAKEAGWLAHEPPGTGLFSPPLTNAHSHIWHFGVQIPVLMFAYAT